MPRRSSRIAQKKRVNYNEDAMFYRRTQTKKSDWQEVEELDPEEGTYRKRFLEKLFGLQTEKEKKRSGDSGSGRRETGGHRTG